MAHITVILLFCSLSAYAGEILLDESEAKIHTVHQDTVIRLDESTSDRLILVENQDLDTYGSITNKDQTMHSASWMGPYGNYLIHVPGQAEDFKIQVRPLKSSVDNTTVKLTLISLKGKTDNFIEAVHDYTQANDLRIKHYLGHDNHTQRAIEFFKAAAEGFKQEGAVFFLALTHFELGNALLGVGEQLKGLEHLKQAVALWSLNHPIHALKATNAVGLACWKTGQLNKALQAFEQIIQNYTSDLHPLMLAQAVNNAGLINLELGEFTEARSQFKQSLTINGVDINFEKATSDEIVRVINHRDDIKNAAASLNNLALAFDKLGEPERAETLWLAYIELSENVTNRTTLAKAKNNLGMHYLRKGTYEPAQQFLESAEQVFAENSQSRWLSMAQHNLGTLYDELGLTDLAEIYFKKALHIRDPDNHPKGHMASLNQLATVYRKQHKLQDSLSLSEELLVLAEKHNNVRYKALSHLNQYAIYQQQADLTRAGQHIDHAVKYIKGTPFQRLSSQIHITRAEFLMATDSDAEAVEILQKEVKTLEKIWNTRLLNKANNLLARAHYLGGNYHVAQQVIDKELKNINFYLNNTTNIKIASHIQGLLAETLNIQALILHELGQSEQGLLKTMQHSRQFQTLQDNLRHGIQSERQQIAQLLQTIKNKSKALENQQLSADERERLEDDIIELKAEIDFSYQRAQVSKSHQLSLKEIQQQLNAETLLLVYSIGETDGISWWISRDRFITHKVPGEKPLKKLISLSRDELTGRDRGYQHSKQLSQILTKPLAEFSDIKTIQLITDEPLNLVPFSSLQDGRKNNALPIAASSSVQRVRSIQALQQSVKPLRENVKALVVADPIYNADDNRLMVEPSQQVVLKSYPRLSHSQQESDLIKSRLETTILTGFDASKAKLLATDLTPFNVLHIATHAFFHPEIPGLSSLVLSAYTEQGQPQPTAYFRALDIAEMNKHFDLTVLSGCETGIGASDDALGLTGLTESFLQAGSDYVVSSLWQVEDQASSRFMGHFYHHLAAEKTIDQAFWFAQQAMLKNPRTRHPKYWAGWFLIKQ